MRISVIIPARDRGELLVRAVESVLAQDAPEVETIVVDDGSTDRSAARLRERFGDSVSVLEQAHLGATAARNRGAAAATGELVSFLDSDDEALPDWASSLVAEAEGADRLALVFCGMREIDAAGKEASLLLPQPLGPLFNDMTGLFLAGAFAVRRQAFTEVGGYDEELTSSQQTELGFRLSDWCAERDARSAAIPRALVRRHLHPGARLRKDSERVLRGTERILELHADRLTRDRRTKADYHAVAGVRAARLGLDDRMRHHFRQAVKAHPGSPRHLGRLLVGSLRPLARLKWPRA